MKKTIITAILMGCLPLCHDAYAFTPQEILSGLSPEDDLKARKIAHAQLVKLKNFYTKINANPELNLQYREKLNETLKQTSNIYIPPKEMTPEQKLIFLRAVNKRLKERQFSREQEIARSVDQQLAEAQRQALELNAQQTGLAAPTPQGQPGAALTQASVGLLKIPAVPEMRTLSGVNLDSESSSSDEVKPLLVRTVAKASRDLKSKSSSQSALNADIKNANRDRRLSTNAQYGGSENATDDYLKQVHRSQRTTQIRGMG